MIFTADVIKEPSGLIPSEGHRKLINIWREEIKNPQFSYVKLP